MAAALVFAFDEPNDRNPPVAESKFARRKSTPDATAGSDAGTPDSHSAARAAPVTSTSPGWAWSAGVVERVKPQPPSLCWFSRITLRERATRKPGAGSRFSASAPYAAVLNSVGSPK